MSTRRSVLFVHQNFPGQFPRIAQALVARGDRVAALGFHTARNMPGVDVRRWTLAQGSSQGIIPIAVRAEADLLRADATARAAAQLAKDGFTPDVIVANPGWGETLHLREVWPNARQLLLVEYWYGSKGGDVGFDPEFGPATLPLDQAMALNARNLGQALACAQADAIICPTRFQASMFPAAIRGRITVHHEGIDVAQAARRPDAKLKLPDGRILRAGDPVVTYISRVLEPVRGFHRFMRALPIVQRAVPDAQVVVIGSDTDKGYGLAPPPGASWKQVMLAELGDRLDLGRVHFLGRVAHQQMMAALSVSAAHVYLTYPFTLSWSLLEAMACGCLVIGSDTAPVRDAISPGHDGVLVDFFAEEALAARLVEALRGAHGAAAMRDAARRTVLERFDARTTGVPDWLAAIDAL